MRKTRLYTAQTLQVEQQAALSQEQAHYLAHVLRLRCGDSVILFNGDGGEYAARIEQLSRKQAVLQVVSHQQRACESPLHICLGLGISRGQHMDTSVQKAVELGVQTIVPLITEFSNVRIKQDRIENKMAHWQHIITSATEQCGRTRLTALQRPLELADFLAQEDIGLKLMLHPDASERFADIDGKPDNVSLLIGPEGGFSDTETALARQHQFQLFRFGPRILRAETAVIAAVATCQSRWGDLGH